MTSRRFILTIFNVNDEQDKLETFCTGINNIKICNWQFEQGVQTEHPHIQLYLVADKSVRPSQVKTWFINNPHVEIAKGDHESCVDYCSKDEGRLKGPFFYPTEMAVKSHVQGKRYDIDTMFKMVKEGKKEVEIAEQNPGAYARSFKALNRYHNLVFPPVFRPEIVVNCFYGAPGSGKSKQAWDDALALVGGDVEGVYSKSAGDWWDGYHGQKVVVIDDFYGGIRFSEFLKILDHYPLSVQIKGGFVAMRATHFFITSNTHPRDWYSGIKDKVDLNALKRRLTSLVYYDKCPDGTFQKIPQDLTTQTWDQTFSPTTIQLL